jgi:large subunit ribosomal protein L24
MAKVHIKKDDEVRVINGKDRGRTGRVVHVQPREGRVMVEGVARSKRHQRASGKRSRSGSQLQQAGIIEREQFVDISNVQLVCKTCGQGTRVGFRIDDDGTKVRQCRKCGADL